MIFIDSNIPMYLVGAAHPNKDLSQRALEDAIIGGSPLVTDVEVFQEILHRYVAIERREAIQPAFDALLGVVDDVFPIELADVESAKAVIRDAGPFSARDAIHVAVMRRYRVSRILTFDTAFDAVPGVERLPL